MLPHHDLVRLQVFDIVQCWVKFLFKQNPTDVCVPEAFLDVVGIVLVINVFVVAAMISTPHQGRVLHGRSTANEGE